MKKVKIAVIGPESSGKSTLVKNLAKVYECPYVNEYAREYIDSLNRRYNYDDLERIAREQKRKENDAFAKPENMIICDSSLVTMKIWSLDKFGKCSHWIENQIDNEYFDLYLLCKPDLSWKPDPQREDEKRREYLFDMYYRYLTEQKNEFRIVEGQNDQRTNIAIAHIEEYCTKF